MERIISEIAQSEIYIFRQNVIIKVRSALFNPGKVSRINVAHFMAGLITNEKTWQKWEAACRWFTERIMWGEGAGTELI